MPVGVYGGEVRMIHFDPVWCVSNYDWNSERLLHYTDKDMRTIVPNIFESWEVSPDGTTFTVKMRKGMKFSDGEPLTTEDVRFYIEDIWFNTDLNASPMWQIRFDGKANETPAKLEVIDDFTFKLTYAAPFGALPAHMTRWEPATGPASWDPRISTRSSTTSIPTRPSWMKWPRPPRLRPGYSCSTSTGSGAWASGSSRPGRRMTHTRSSRPGTWSICRRKAS